MFGVVLGRRGVPADNVVMGSRRLVRSMFVRRVLVIGGAITLGMGALAAASYRLTVVMGDELRAAAERTLLDERWTPTVRGRILDRKGRVLAYDRPAFDLEVDYALIVGDWATREAARVARERAGERWNALDVTDREALIDAELPVAQARIDALWDEIAVALDADRAELDERRQRITQTVERMASAVWERRLEQRREELSRDRETAVEVTLEDVKTPLREQVTAHTVATGVVGERAFALRRLAENHEGVEVVPGGRRTYPFERVVVDVDRSSFPPPLREEGSSTESVEVAGVGTHLLGWMRGVFAEDTEARPRVESETGLVDRGHYRPGDLVGSTGVESARENELRGLRGRVVTHRDTGVEEVVSPVNGGDVRLTIDVMLQARVQALLTPDVGLARVNAWHGNAVLEERTPLNGSAVVLDVQTGEVLAAVSMPTFTRDQMREHAQAMAEDRLNAPLVNRPLAKAYMPGSPVKPLILAAAVTEGVHALGRAIACTGHLIEDKPDRLRCWIYKRFGTTHNDQLGHDLNAREAIGLSCNIYFYTLGRDLGPRRLKAWLERFGIGERIGLGVGIESAGNAGDKLDGKPLYLGDATLMGIGQGPVTWTPLQAADAYATLARDGVRIAPRLFKDAPVRGEDLRLDLSSVDAALDGLRMAVEDERGTGYAIRYPTGERLKVFDVEGVRVWAKTGTATAAPTLGADGEVLRSGDHAWIVALVGDESDPSPRYALSVVLEYAGSGGRAAGPLANEVVRALVAEGYL